MIFLGIVIALISFGFLCEGLNKIEIKLFEALQKRTRALFKEEKGVSVCDFWDSGYYRTIYHSISRSR